MAENISSGELSVVNQLVLSGMTRHEALVITLLVCRSYSRPIADLITTLQHYSGLEDSGFTTVAINSLAERGFLVEEQNYNSRLVGPPYNIRALLANYCTDQSLGERLTRLRRINDEYVTVIGPLRDIATFNSYLDLLRGAHSEIVFPMVATSADTLEATPILIERAQAGVQIRVLGATPGLASLIRGKTLDAVTRTRINEWKKVAQRNRNVSFRVTDVASDLVFASSVCIDSRVLRLVVYDFERERSKEGVVVEFSANAGTPLNVIDSFMSGFNQSWKAAFYPSILGRVYKFLRELWEFILGIFLSILCFGFLIVFGKQGFLPIGEENLSLVLAVVSSMAASLLITGLVDLIPKLKARKGRK
jgi:hypothetical protein